MTLEIQKLKLKVRMLIVIFMTALVLSGLTAFPLEVELSYIRGVASDLLELNNPVYLWIAKVYDGLKEVNSKYPFISYGTDWLAFAHIVIAIVFVGPLRDPVKNIWVIHFGIIACLLIFPLAFIAGEIRGIPFYWRVIDCSFGAIGIIPLMLCDRYIKRIMKSEQLYNEKQIRL